MTTTRREVLGAAGAAGATAAMAGCGGGEEEPEGGAEVRVATGDVPEGGGTVTDGVVVTQPSAGEYKAFDAACPHQGCSVDEVTSSAIVCPCHGSEFDPSTGEETKGPATEGLTSRTATVEGDEIVIS